MATASTRASTNRRATPMKERRASPLPSKFVSVDIASMKHRERERERERVQREERDEGTRSGKRERRENTLPT